MSPRYIDSANTIHLQFKRRWVARGCSKFQNAFAVMPARRVALPGAGASAASLFIYEGGYRYKIVVQRLRVSVERDIKLPCRCTRSRYPWRHHDPHTSSVIGARLKGRSGGQLLGGRKQRDRQQTGNEAHTAAASCVTLPKGGTTWAAQTCHNTYERPAALNARPIQNNSISHLGDDHYQPRGAEHGKNVREGTCAARKHSRG